MGSCSLLFDALRSSSRAGAIRLQRKTWPLRSRSKLSEGLGAASAGVITRGCPAVHWHIDFLVALPSAQDLLLCAKHLFVAAMVAWVHPGPAAYWQFSGLHFEPAARVGQKSPAHLPEARGRSVE